jgi:hypothetical protein
MQPVRQFRQPFDRFITYHRQLNDHEIPPQNIMYSLDRDREWYPVK